MTARERLPPWHERQTLPNGREVLIRPIRPEDAEPLRAGFGLLQPEEVRQRFLHSVRDLSPEMAERFTRINPKTEFALVAAEPLPPGDYRAFTTVEMMGAGDRQTVRTDTFRVTP